MTIRDLADTMGTSKSQVQRLLSAKRPANITLDTVLRAADAMGLEVELSIRDEQQGQSYIISHSCHAQPRPAWKSSFASNNNRYFRVRSAA